MRKLLVAATAVAALLSQPAHARWYVGHLGAEVCVPLDDMGPDAQRLYYGTGQFHTPADFTSFLHRMGATVIPLDVRGQEEHIRAFHVIGDGLDTYLVLFHEREVCRQALKEVENER